MNVKIVEEREASRSILWCLASVELVPVTERRYRKNNKALFSSVLVRGG